MLCCLDSDSWVARIGLKTGPGKTLKSFSCSQMNLVPLCDKVKPSMLNHSRR